MQDEALVNTCFRLKARGYTLTVMQLMPCHLSDFQQALVAIISKAPNMFKHTPVVLDLKALKGASFDIKGFVEVMRANKLSPIAIQHASVIQQKAAVGSGLAIISAKDLNVEDVLESQTQTATQETDDSQETQSSTTHDAEKENGSLENHDAVDTTPSRISKVITTPVRSGQQIFAKGADLIILAAVGPGAEVLADGHIHIYGPLRGRALAGVNGDTSARIFCTKLEAELISIAGRFLMLEPSDPYRSEGAKQIVLKNDKLAILPL